MMVAEKVGNPLSLDNFTDLMKKTGFARVRVELDASKPLVLGVPIQGKNSVFWQQFVYGNLPSVCFQCGWMGHTVEGCQSQDAHQKVDSRNFGLCPGNFVAGAGEDDALKQGFVGMGSKPAAGGGSPIFGSWLVIARIRQPRLVGVPVKGGQGVYRGKALVSSSDPPSSSLTRSSPTPFSSSPNSPPDVKEWQKHSKVARQRSPDAAGSDLSDGGAMKGAGEIFAPIANCMELVPADMGQRG